MESMSYIYKISCPKYDIKAVCFDGNELDIYVTDLLKLQVEAADIVIEVIGR